MEFQFTEEQNRFRKEVQDFLKKEVPAEWISGERFGTETPETDEEWQFHLSLQRKMAEKGWLSLWWPREYGGQGRSRLDYVILEEEISYRGSPGFDVFGQGMAAPVILSHGTAEQKRRHLPPIGRGEITWCECFSEPNAGSDLASLTTRAVEDGDHFIIDGHKTWTTGGHRADWGLLLARTGAPDSRHRGLTLFLIDMKSPGITMKPIYNLGGLHTWDEEFFDGVRVPRENMIGEKNKGWYVATTALNGERNGINFMGACRRSLDRLIEYVRNNEALKKNPIIRNSLASLATKVEVARLLCYHVAWMHDKGLSPVFETSVIETFVHVLGPHIAEMGLQILGQYGQLGSGSEWSPLAGTVERTYVNYPAWAIGGGTPDIQRTIIARMGLGLPS